MNKNLMIGLGVLAVAGIGLYMWKKSKDESSSSDETKSGVVDSGGGGTESPRYRYKKKLSDGTIIFK